MVSLLLGITVFLALAGVWTAATQRQAARRRAAVERATRVLAGDVDPELAASILRDDDSDLSSLLSDAAKRYPALQRLDLLLYRAARPISLDRLLAVTAVLAVLGAVLGWTLGFPLLALLGAAPIAVVWRKARKRMKLFDEQFPGALALFSRALRAGHGLSSALQMVGSELPDPVGPEFALVCREITLGLSAQVALANLQQRLGATDLPVFVTAVLVQLETGGNLAETLDNLGSVIRNRILFDGKVKALTAQSMTSANILAVVPGAMLLIMSTMNPEFMAPMFDTELGRTLLGIAAGMVGLGWYVCRRVARVLV